MKLAALTKYSAREIEALRQKPARLGRIVQDRFFKFPVATLFASYITIL